MAIDRAVFICGCGHSGTSLLANIFANHPEVFIPLRETATFLKKESVLRKLHRLERQFCESGKKFLFEKTPRHIHVVGHIRKLIKFPKFIMVVRDGRDVAASFIKRNGDAMVGAERWLNENRIVCSEAQKLDVAVIRYEDLITDLELTLKSLCSFAEIPYSPSMLDYHETPRLWFGASDFTKGDGKNGRGHIQLRSWQINQPIFDGRGQWRGLLTKSDLDFFDRDDVAQIMHELGYS